MDAQAMGIEHAAVSIGAINIKWYIVTAQVWSSCSCYFIVYKLALLLPSLLFQSIFQYCRWLIICKSLF